MNKGTSFLAGAFIAALFLLFNSCQKNQFPRNHFPDPLAGDCQVAEFHNPMFDELFSTPLHYYFKKNFDAAGKAKEIICSFAADLLPSQVLSFQLDLQIVDRGHIVYFLTRDTVTHGRPDTTAILYLNWEGRPDSCVSYSNLNPHFNAGPGAPIKTFYSYRNNRFFSVKTAYYFSKGGEPSIAVDTAHYDGFGNVIAFGTYNRYEYDYHHKAPGPQFYLDDYMQEKEELYLLEYLGYFPELTSPVHLRTNTVNEIGSFPESGQQFDAEGKMIVYNGFMEQTITWRCR